MNDPVVPVVGKPCGPSIALDASIAVGIAALTALGMGLAQKESYEYVNPYVRFWLVLGVGVTVQGMHALAKFRDGKFQRYNDAIQRQEEANKSGVPIVVTNTVTPDK